MNRMMESRRGVWLCVWCVAVVVSVCVASARAALLGVDLGGEYLKVSLVKPGKIPISIAVNAMTKRRTPAVWGIVKGERLLGEDAAAIVPRYPEKVIFNARELVGVPFSEDMERELFTKHGLKYEFDRDPNTSGAVYASWKSENGTAYDSIELLSNLLYQAKEIGKLNTGAEVKDAVISVPAYFGQSQLQSVAVAAEVAGLNVMALTTDHAAAALQFGIDRDFKNQTQAIVFYDMGSTSLTTSLIEFSAYKGKDMGKKKDIGQFIVKGVTWDSTIGAAELERVLTEHFVDEFHEKHKVDVDIRTVPRAMAKMKKNIKKLKEVLSANKDGFLSVQSLYDDIDFSSKITREKFEELAGDFWERATAPLKKLLEETGIKAEDVHGVELVGGCTRVPRLQKTLTDFLGGRNLDKHLDASEAIALGTGFKAANLSTSFRVRKFGASDVNPYSIQVRTYPLENSDADFEPITKLIASRWKKSNVPKTFALANSTSDFGIQLEYVGDLPPGLTAPEIAAYNITGVADKIAKFNNTGKHEVSVKFDWQLESILYVEKATVAVLVNETYPVQVPIEEEEEEEEEAKEGEKKGEEGSAPEAPKGEDGATGDADKKAADGSESKSESGDDGKKKEEEKQKKKEKKKQKFDTIYKQREVTKRILLSVSPPLESLPQPDDAQFKAYVDRMKAWEQFDEDKRQKEKAKNDLEGYIIAMKELLYDETVQEVTTEEQREKYKEALMDGEDWLYGDGDNAPLQEYKTKQKELSDEGEAIKFRASELEKRPTAWKMAKARLDEAKAKLGTWNMDRPWLTDAQKTDMKAAMDALDNFLVAKEKEQAKLANHETPAYTSEDVATLVRKMIGEVAKVSKIQKPKDEKKKEEEDAMKKKKKMKQEEGDAKKKADQESGGQKEGEEEQGDGEEEEEEEGEGEEDGDDDEEEEGDDDGEDEDEGEGEEDLPNSDEL